MQRSVVYADDVDIEQKLEETVLGQLDNLDFSQFEDIVGKLDDNQSGFFGSGSFFDKVSNLTTGNSGDNQVNLWTSLINVFFEDVLEFMPLVSMVISIAIAYSLVSNARPKLKKNSVGDIIHFTCYGAIIVLLMSSVVSMLKLTTSTITTIKDRRTTALSAESPIPAENNS